MSSIAHSAKRVSTNLVAFVTSIFLTTILCSVFASASNIEIPNDCANGIGQGQTNAPPAQFYTDSCREPGNYSGSTDAPQSTYVAGAASDSLDLVQLDVFAADLSTGVLLSGIGTPGSSEAVSDVNASDSPDRVPEPTSFTLMCVGLLAGLGIHLRKTYLA
jgi:hypothetical protein